MGSVPHVVIAFGMFLIVLGLPLGLYALLTRKQRQSMREIRVSARERGWRYRLRRWQGNPTAFRIDGQARTGLSWVITSGSASGYDKGWSVVLAQRFPELAGEVDFAILPRELNDASFPLGSTDVSPQMQSRVAGISGTVASASEFSAKAQESPSGMGAFDSAYRILTLSQQSNRMTVDQSLAGRIQHWPEACVSPHSILAWRDPFGFHFQARLPGPPNWATVAYLVELTEDLLKRLPPPSPVAPSGVVDRTVARFLQ